MTQRLKIQTAPPPKTARPVTRDLTDAEANADAGATADANK
jgi:hypothetical protein